MSWVYPALGLSASHHLPCTSSANVYAFSLFPELWGCNGCPIPGSVQCQVGWGFEQPGL